MKNNRALLVEDNYYDYEDLYIRVVEFIKQRGLPICNQEIMNNDYCNLTYIAEGRAICYLKSKPFLLRKGNFVFISRGDDIQLYADKRDKLICYTLIFDHFYNNDYKELPFPTVFNIESNIILKDLFEEINKVWEEKSRGYQLIAKAIVLRIFHELIFQTHHKNDDNVESKRIEIIKEFVQKNYHRHIQIEDVANILKLNPVYLGSYFKEKTGYTVRQYINCVRISKAKSLLTSGKYSVSEVARCCGYQDIYYFSRVFKQIEGVPPSRFIK